MDVDLDGLEVAMAQDELSNAQVAGGPDQLGGHCVAKGVGRDAGGELSGFSVALDDVLEGADREGLAEPVHQERRLGSDGKAALLVEPEQEGLYRLLAPPLRETPMGAPALAEG